MAPVHHSCLYIGNSLDSESGNDSGSESEGGDSSASGSRSSSPDSGNNKTRNQSRSRSASPANSQASRSSRSEAGSQGHRSRRDSASSGSPQRIARRSPSGSPVEAEENAGSPNRQPSRSPSPGDQKSGSGSPARVSDGGRSRSESPADEKSNASEKNSERSRSPSPEVNKTRKSRSRSVGSNVSRQSSRGSRSGSAESDNDSHRSESPTQKTTESKPSKNKKGIHSPGEEAGSKSPSKKSRSQSGSESGDNSSKKNSRKSISPKTKSHSNTPEKIVNHEKQGSRSPDEKNEKQEGRRSRSASRDSESGSDREPKDTTRKRKRTVLSDDSGSDAERKKIDTGAKEDDGDESEKDLVIDAEALFGDASDISSDEGNRKKKAAKKLSDDEPEPPRERESDVESMKAKSGDEENEMEMEEKEEEDKENVPEEPQPETRIDVQIPKITTNLGKDIHFVKLPNFLSVETRPFDPTTYEDEIDEEETLDEEGRARLKLKVENTIRWKEITKQNGEFDKQSNARFVKWSDGSMSLHLGSEIFDVYKQPLQGDHNHLFIRQGTGLQGQAVFRTKLTFRPHSTESFTHRKMTMSLADRSQKTAGIKILSLVGKDPEAHRGELIKKEEERLRASVRRESKQRRIREKGVNRGLSAGYLEPDRYGDVDSDDEGISINAIKKQHKNKMNNPRDDRSHIYSSDEEGSDIETRRARRLDKAKALKDSDSEGSGEGGGEGEGNKSGDRTSSGED